MLKQKCILYINYCNEKIIDRNDKIYSLCFDYINNIISKNRLYQLEYFFKDKYND